MRRILVIAFAFSVSLTGCNVEKPEPDKVREARAQATTPATSAATETSCCDDQPTPVAVVVSTTKPEVHTAAKPNDTPVQIQVVKYKQLKDAVKANKGKIIVVDVWATFCIPCMKEFPNLVEIHQQHAKDGVVCMSVSVDDPDNREKALKFLQSKGAAFSNFLLDEDASVWQEAWKSKGVPIVFVFNRDGTQAGKFDSDDPDKQFSYKDVKARVEELLKK